jgi:hypothetical protein
MQSLGKMKKVEQEKEKNMKDKGEKVRKNEY